MVSKDWLPEAEDRVICSSVDATPTRLLKQPLLDALTPLLFQLSTKTGVASVEVFVITLKTPFSLKEEPSKNLA